MLMSFVRFLFLPPIISDDDDMMGLMKGRMCAAVYWPQY